MEFDTNLGCLPPNCAEFSLTGSADIELQVTDTVYVIKLSLKLKQSPETIHGNRTCQYGDNFNFKELNLLPFTTFFLTDY